MLAQYLHLIHKLKRNKKPLDECEKESEKENGLKLNIQKTI